ncbi:hypothetical protein DVR12_02325 [Chitinophaga silvatica]|uniref:Uncharacterized protein n=1 Tax=Chitinophaga silvatica TaxID=2282649 RepID=A0A3E1YGY7_9BACT|nr:hypothetical protein DVR12_02325 [Chitinophaga silvatica]
MRNAVLVVLYVVVLFATYFVSRFIVLNYLYKLQDINVIRFDAGIMVMLILFIGVSIKKSVDLIQGLKVPNENLYLVLGLLSILCIPVNMFFTYLYNLTSSYSIKSDYDILHFLTLFGMILLIHVLFARVYNIPDKQ